jgi:hypothetical protein
VPISEKIRFCTCGVRKKTTVQKIAPACIGKKLKHPAFLLIQAEIKNESVNSMH